MEETRGGGVEGGGLARTPPPLPPMVPPTPALKAPEKSLKPNPLAPKARKKTLPQTVEPEELGGGGGAPPPTVVSRPNTALGGGGGLSHSRIALDPRGHNMLERCCRGVDLSKDRRRATLYSEWDGGGGVGSWGGGVDQNS